MIVTTTQIKISSIRGFIRFILLVRKIIEQLNQTDGLVFMKFNGLRTLTGWESVEAMKNIKSIGKTKTVTWETQTEPEWDKAKKDLVR